MSAIPENTSFSGFFIEVADTDLDFRSVGVSDPMLTGRQILSYCDATPREEFVVLQWLPSGDIEELRPDEVVDIRGAVRAKFIVSKADRLFRVVLNDRSVSWPKREIAESALRILGDVPADEIIYVRREDVPDERIEPDHLLALGEVGVENVYSKAAVWKLNVQGVVIDSAEPTIQVRRALERAGFNPDQGWIIILKAADTKRQVGLEEFIDLRTPGIEKLRLTPREINNGEASTLRRAFRLLPADERGLDERRLHWETIIDGGRRWLILHNFELPSGYSTPHATIAFEVPPSYPTAEIDMFYCYPRVSRPNGGGIPQTEATQAIEGRVFQRWSRHRGPGAPWRPGVDNVITHLALVEAALLREVER